MNQNRFFPVLKASESKLSFHIESKSIKLSFDILDKRMICTCINCCYFHVLESMKRTWFMDTFCFLSQLTVRIASITITLIFICIRWGFTIEDKSVLLADCDCHDTLTNIYESRFLTVFKTFPPSSEEARLEGMLMSAGSNSR